MIDGPLWSTGRISQNNTDAPMVHVLFEILLVDHKGPSITPAKPR